MPPSDSQTFLRGLNKKGAQASRLFLQKEKATGKMPVLPYKFTSTGKLIDVYRSVWSSFHNFTSHHSKIPCL